VAWAGQHRLGLRQHRRPASARYIGSAELLNPDGALGGDPLQISSFTYLDLTVGYTFPSRTRSSWAA